MPARALNRVSGLAKGMLASDVMLLVAMEGGVLWRGADLFCFAWAVVRSRQGAPHVHRAIVHLRRQWLPAELAGEWPLVSLQAGERMGLLLPG